MKKRILTLISIIALVLGLSALLMACEDGNDKNDKNDGNKVDYSVTVLSPAETPLSDVTVSWVTSKNETAGTATTDADGLATASLPAGTYTIYLSGNALASYDYDAVSVTAKTRDTEIQLAVKRVTYSVTVNDKTGAAAQGVTVAWTKNGVPETAETNASGRAERELEYGTYTVTLSNLPEGNTYDGSVSVSGAAPSATFNLRALAGDAVNFKVTVRSEGGLLFKNYTVMVSRDDSLWNTGVTNDEGVFTFSDEANEYEIDIADVPDGYSYDSVTLSAVNTDAEVVLKSTLLNASQADSNTQYVMGDIFHDYTFTTPYELNGAVWSQTVSEILRTKKALLINNWGMDCSWCLTEMGDMDEMYRKYSDDIEIVAVSNYNYVGDSDLEINNFYATNGYTFPMMRDVNGFAYKFGINGWPTTVIIDRYGAIARIEKGAITSAEAWERMIVKYIGDDYVQTFTPGEHVSGSINIEVAKPDITVDADHYDNINGALLKDGYTLPSGVSIEWYAEETYEDAWPFLYGKLDNVDSNVPVMYASNGSFTDSVHGERTGKANSMAILYAKVTVGAGKAFTFEYFAETEAHGDILYMLWDGRIIREISGDSLGWQNCYLYSEITEGTHTLSITYVKDGSSNVGMDNVFIRNIEFVDVSDITTSTDMFRGAGYGNIVKDANDNSVFEHYADVAMAADGYYHVNVNTLENANLAGNDNSPLLLANVMNVTAWNNSFSINRLASMQDANTGEYIINCIFTIDGVTKDYRGDLTRYLAAASASEVTYCVPVDDFLQKLLVAFMKEYKKAERIAAGLSVANEDDYWHEKEWLEICYFYSHYGDGDPVGNPILGLMPETAIEVEEDTECTADITRLTPPFPFRMYTFTPDESAVYKIESLIPDEDADEYSAQIWFYDDDSSSENPLASSGADRINRDGLNEQNFELYYYMTAGRKYYVDLAFLDMQSGTYKFKITKIGQSYTHLVPASYDDYDMVIGENGEWTGELTLAGAVEYELLKEADTDEEYYHVKDSNSEDSYIYLDVTNVSTGALGTVPLNKLIDLTVKDPLTKADLGYKMFDFRYYVRYHKTIDGGDEIVTYDPDNDSMASASAINPLRYQDYTETLREYIGNAPTSGKDQGLIKVNAELVKILSAFLELRTEAVYDAKIPPAYANEWLRFCWCYKTHDAGNP